MATLIVHIGAGKTGTSSIQSTLQQNKAGLDSQGVKYLGIMLENASYSPKEPWQTPKAAANHLHLTKETQFCSSAFTVLHRELNALGDSGYTRSIWSNEVLLEKPDSIIPALLKLQDHGHNITIQCYIRRHDSWARSAYVQWGIKHKTYSGPVVSFNEWTRHRDSSWGRFHDLLKPWQDCFGDNLMVFNFDFAGNVVEHFLRVNDIKGIEPRHGNASPPVEEIAAQAVFNSRSQDPILPLDFDEFMRIEKRHDLTGASVPPLDELMPSVDELIKFSRERQEDIQSINALLLSKGEPPLSFDTPPRDTKHPTPWQMDQFLLKLVYALYEEVALLRRKIDKIGDTKT